jgi:hypothetical protein
MRPTDATQPRPALATGAVSWEGSAGAASGQQHWWTRHERPRWWKRSQGWTGRSRWQRHGWPRLGVPGDESGVLVTSASRGNWGQVGGLGGGSLHAHGLSNARSSSPDELGWPRRRSTSWLHGVGRIRVNGGDAFQNGGGDDSDGWDRRGASREP